METIQKNNAQYKYDNFENLQTFWWLLRTFNNVHEIHLIITQRPTLTKAY